KGFSVVPWFFLNSLQFTQLIGKSAFGQTPPVPPNEPLPPRVVELVQAILRDTLESAKASRAEVVFVLVPQCEDYTSHDARPWDELMKRLSVSMPVHYVS